MDNVEYLKNLTERSKARREAEQEKAITGLIFLAPITASIVFALLAVGFAYSWAMACILASILFLTLAIIVFISLARQMHRENKAKAEEDNPTVAVDNERC